MAMMYFFLFEKSKVCAETMTEEQVVMEEIRSKDKEDALLADNSNQEFSESISDINKVPLGNEKEADSSLSGDSNQGFLESISDVNKVPLEAEKKEEVGEETEKEDNECESSKEDIEIAPNEIDLGNYITQMKVGEKQLIVVTLIPLEATKTNVIFYSSNENVASVNGLGRITALAPGKTIITVGVDDINQSFELVVVEKEETKIPVTDIEVQEYNVELEVQKNLNLSATVLPFNATNPELSFESSNTSIATVNSLGVVKGISKGQVEITITADGISKKIPVNVVVKTKQIKVDTYYIVLKSGTSYHLNAEVEPKEAEQEIIYRSMDESIAKITECGIITAEAKGSTTILVSNKDTSVSVAVIVNEEVNYRQDNEPTEELRNYDPIIHQYVDSKHTKIISSNLLAELYRKKENLIIRGEDYEIEIRGNKIVNDTNCFYTDIEREKKEGKEYFTINRGNELHGEVILRLKEPVGKYLYLYNEEKAKYQRIEANDLEELCLTTPGKYMITQEQERSIPDYLLQISIVVSSLLCGVTLLYIVMKKNIGFGNKKKWL